MSVFESNKFNNNKKSYKIASSLDFLYHMRESFDRRLFETSDRPDNDPRDSPSFLGCALSGPPGVDCQSGVFIKRRAFEAQTYFTRTRKFGFGFVHIFV